MRSVEFEGNTYEYDEKALERYSVVEGITLGMENVQGFFWAVREIFAGKSTEYAKRLGDSQAKMGELVAAVFQDAADQSRAVKN